MKNAILIIFTIVLVLVSAACTGPKGATGPVGATGTPGTNAGDIPGNATILMNENFDSQATGVTPTTATGKWQRITTWDSYNNIYTAVTNTGFVSYNKSFMIQGKTTANYERMIVKSPLTDSIPNTLTGKINISFYVKKDNVANKGFCFYIDQFEKARIDLYSDATIGVNTSFNNSIIAGNYTYGIFTKYAIVINLTTQKYDVYANNIMIASNIPCYDSVEQDNGTSPISSSSAVYTTFFGIMTQMNSGYALDTIFVDNVVIYYTPN